MNIEPKCERCGECCSNYTFWMQNRSYDNDQMDLIRFIEYHGGTAVRGSNGEIGVKFPYPCNQYDKENKSCKVHDKRPRMCRDFYCSKVMEKVLNGVHL